MKKPAPLLLSILISVLGCNSNSSKNPWQAVGVVTITDSSAETVPKDADSAYNIVFKDIIANAELPGIKNKYSGIKMENVIVNGAPLVIK